MHEYYETFLHAIKEKESNGCRIKENNILRYKERRDTE